MTPSQKAISLIKFRESLRLYAYQDKYKNWTIGWGHLIKPSEKYMLLPNFRLTRQQADQIHEQDIAIKSNDVNSYLKVRVSQDMFDSLVSFAYNHSPKWVIPIARAINLGHPISMVAQMFLARGLHDRFLQKCRRAEVLLMTTGIVVDPQTIKL